MRRYSWYWYSNFFLFVRGFLPVFGKRTFDSQLYSRTNLEEAKFWFLYTMFFCFLLVYFRRVHPDSAPLPNPHLRLHWDITCLKRNILFYIFWFVKFPKVVFSNWFSNNNKLTFHILSCWNLGQALLLFSTMCSSFTTFGQILFIWGKKARVK